MCSIFGLCMCCYSRHRGECVCAQVHVMGRFALMLPRLGCKSGVHRAPTVGLTVAGLLSYENFVQSPELFPISLAAGGPRSSPACWANEIDRLNTFFTSEA